MTVYYARAIWLWLTERVAVEVRRAFPVRREGKHTEARLDMQWADDIADPTSVAACSVTSQYAGTGTAATTAYADEPDALSRMYMPYLELTHDEEVRAIRDRYRREAWATVAPEPTPNQAMNLWRANDVIPPRIAASLARAQADQTVIDSDLTPETRAALVEQFAGGDVYDGQGEAWFNVFDAIEARAHERLQQARAELDRWFTPVGAS